MKVQLTINIDNSDRALELIGLFYGDHRVAIVDVRVDNFDPRPKVAAVDPLNRPLLPANGKRPAETAKQRIRAQRAEADIFNAERDFQYATDQERNRQRDERAAKKAHNAELIKVRNERHQARMRDVDEARRIKCPTCNAEADERCLKASGAPYDYGFAHAARISRTRGY